MADYPLSEVTVFPSTYDIGGGRKTNEQNLSNALASFAGGDIVGTGFTLPASSDTLALSVAAGKAIISGRLVYIDTPTTVYCANGQTNHIFLKLLKDSLGNVTGAAIEVNTTGITPTDSIKLGTAVASGGKVTSTTDTRPLFRVGHAVYAP